MNFWEIILSALKPVIVHFYGNNLTNIQSISLQCKIFAFIIKFLSILGYLTGFKPYIIYMRVICNAEKIFYTLHKKVIDINGIKRDKNPKHQCWVLESQNYIVFFSVFSDLFLPISKYFYRIQTFNLGWFEILRNFLHRRHQFC